MKHSTAASIAALFSRLGVCRALAAVVRPRSPRSIGNAISVLVRLPRVAKPSNSDQRAAPVIAGSSTPAPADANALPAKVAVHVNFDTALLAKVDAAARRQGISRTAWLHRASFDALGERGRTD
jgi:hypothetical protein